MELIRNWLLAVTCASLIVAAADCLIPAGAVKKTAKLTGGLVLLVAVIGPLATLDYSVLSLELAGLRGEYAYSAADGTKLGADFMKTIIEERARAYILDKAAQLGAECRVEVECRVGEENLPYPAAVTITGELTAAQKKALAKLIEADLAIPADRQNYKEVVQQ